MFGSRRGAAGCCVKAEVTDWWATNETHANRQENQWRCHLDVGVRIAARAAEICPRPTFATLRRSGRALGDYDPVRADTVGSAAPLLLQTMVWREPASRRFHATRRGDRP